ncbi:MAG: DinB family protein [Fimbriimonadaceae bacterium]|nr:DinB family protein [Fimbriimonadaceae bacterium]QYK55553.1 MAG: DinB family protein [Fimbriimonadaceae bacterium]
MPFLESQSQAWDKAHWEFSLVFEGLQDEDLWRRPDPKLLSVGEIACHLVYALAKFANGLDPAAGIESPLAREEAGYYLSTVDQPLALGMTVSEVEAELDRVQKAAKAAFLGLDAERGDPLPIEGPGETFGDFADYMVFHAAYHTGQAFSARHLMGHRTNDN